METLFEKKIDVERKVKNIIAYKLGLDEKKITSQSNFSDNFYTDFLDVVDLVMEFEDEFNISIPADQIEKICTVNEAIESVMSNSGKQRILNKIEMLSSIRKAENIGV